ncbi:MAG: CDP-diacylglycerol--glycerol-3-phosphate 3-phosphatidyltransferase, partial [Stygiobacter sp. RIFOXYC12_FULL_38_8]
MLLPNQLTVLRIILTPIFIVLFLSDDPLLIQISLGVFLAAALTDWYDGWLARKFNYITEWGKFMDPLADKILTSTAFFGFVSLGILEFWMVLVIVVRDFLITLLRAYADYRKVSFTTSNLAKWKTFSQMFFLYYLLILYTLRTVPSLNQNYASLFESLLNQELIFR